MAVNTALATAPLAEADYVGALQALLPPGPAWPDLRAGGVEGRQLGPLAAELVRLDQLAAAMLAESDPRTANFGGVFFERWEAVLGLPDACALAFSSGDALTEAARRAAVVSKFTELAGGQTPAYYISLAAVFGFVITITEFEPWDVMGSVDDPMLGDEWASAWQVNFELAVNVVEADVMSGVDEPLVDYTVNSLLECIINRVKPAHTAVLFNYF